MSLLLLPPVLFAMYVLLVYGGCDCHKVENGHVADYRWHRVW